MARPAGYQWKPLGWDTDPIPGDPQEISAEAAHLTQMAKEITGQVAALRKISADGVQIGQSPDAIRSAASTLAGQLVKVADRYHNVAVALRGWGPELEQAQRMSVQALNQAEIPYARLNQPVILPSGSNLTAAQQQEVTAFHAAMRRAEDELAAARALLGRAISLRDSQSAYTQAKIDAASSDALTDSWWDHVENWVDHHAGVLVDICTGLEIVATGLAVAAIIFSGVGILVALGIGATALALAGRTLLASAGDGSWFDVMLDAAALLTFGTGKIVGRMMEGVFEATDTAGRGLVQAARDASPLGKLGRLAAQASQVVEDSTAIRSVSSGLNRLGLGQLGGGITGLSGRVGKFLGQAGDTALEKASPSLDKTLATVSEHVRAGEVALHGGEKESLLLTRRMAAITARFPESSEIAQLSAKFHTLLNWQRGIFGFAEVTDLGDKIGSLPIPGAEPYHEFKDHLVTPGGFTAAEANGIVDVAQFVPVIGTGPAAFRAASGGGW